VASEDQPCQTPMKKLQKKQQNKLQAWIELRKNTTPVHWVYGLLCAFLMLSWGILAGWVAMGAFAGDEAWNDWCDRTREGCSDWWEAFLTFMVGQGVLALLSYLGVVSIGWW
jgi:hypothetical protein